MRELTRDEAVILSEMSAALTEVYTTSGDDCDDGRMLIDDAFKAASRGWGAISPPEATWYTLPPACYKPRCGGSREGAMVLIIWTDWNGDEYAFCGRLCLEMYRRYLADPTMKHMLPVILPTFGCWWCGGDLAGAVKWCEDHDDSGIVKLEETRDEGRAEPA